MTGLKERRDWDSGPPWTTTTTAGRAFTARGRYTNNGMRSPSKLSVSAISAAISRSAVTAAGLTVRRLVSAL